MTEETPSPPPADHSEDIVGQVVERAAEKAAQQATAQTPNGGPPVLAKKESLAIVAVLLIFQLTTVWLLLQVRNEGNQRSDTITVVCEVLSKFPNVDPAKIAECLR
jgi:hypothetical protein